jgi:hypothetical protein
MDHEPASLTIYHNVTPENTNTLENASKRGSRRSSFDSKLDLSTDFKQLAAAHGARALSSSSDGILQRRVAKMLKYSIITALALLFVGVQSQYRYDGVRAADKEGKYTLKAPGIRAQFIPYGASITNLFVKDQNGIERDVVLGWDNATYYTLDASHPHLGGVPGRYANRIKNRYEYRCAKNLSKTV